MAETQNYFFSKSHFKRNGRTYILIGIIAVVWIVFSFLTKGSFMTMRNISNLLRQMSAVGIMASGMVLVIVSGGIDLSVGALAGSMGMLAASRMRWYGWSTGVTIPVVLGTGFGIGTAQGATIAYGNVPPFIATLGGMLILQGIQVGISRGTTISPLNLDYIAIGQNYLGKGPTYILAVVSIIAFMLISVRSYRAKKRHGIKDDTARGVAIKSVVFAALLIGFSMLINSYESVPLPVVIMIFITIIMKFVSENTTFGRKIYAIGGNLQAAEYTGINVRKNTIAVYMVNGLLAAIAGVVLSARLNAGSATTGTSMEMQVIAAAVIGGTRMSGGYGKVMGALLGALFMATLLNGMSLMNLESYWQNIVQGIVLVVAVFVDKRTNA